MGRIGSGVCGLLLALGLFSFPVTARASDGFLGGLEDLAGTRQVETEQRGYEESYQEEYSPELREVEGTPDRALPEEATTVDYVNDTVNRFNQVNYGSQTRSWLSMIIMLLGGNGAQLGVNMKEALLLPAVGIVFMWWGVRKAKSIVMNGFRKGKITT